MDKVKMNRAIDIDGQIKSILEVRRAFEETFCTTVKSKIDMSIKAFPKGFNSLAAAETLLDNLKNCYDNSKLDELQREFDNL